MTVFTLCNVPGFPGWKWLQALLSLPCYSLSRLLSHALRASAFHYILQMESLLAGQDLRCAGPPYRWERCLSWWCSRSDQWVTICKSSAFLLIKTRLSIGSTGLSSSLPWLKWASVTILSGRSRSFTRSFAVPFLSMVSPLALSSLPVGCVRAVPCFPYCVCSPWKCSLLYVRCYPDNSELKQLRQRPQRRLQKTIGLMIKTITLQVHHAF